jgi:hypothetical protein
MLQPAYVQKLYLSRQNSSNGRASTTANDTEGPISFFGKFTESIFELHLKVGMDRER